MGLLPSEGNTYILDVIDNFSKSCCLLPLKGILTAMETAELLFNHVFRYFGIQERIVRSGSPVYFQGIESFFHPPRCDCRSLLKRPCPVEWADGEKDPEDWKFPMNLLPRPPELLKPGAGLSMSRTTHVRTRLPAFSVLVVWGIIRCPIGQLLVPRSRGSGMQLDVWQMKTPTFPPGQKV